MFDLSAVDVIIEVRRPALTFLVDGEVGGHARTYWQLTTLLSQLD